MNSYSKPKYLIDISKILQGMPEFDRLLASPLGKLFSLHVRQCSLSGQLVHQMLCRQLYTENIDELWFVFGGHPLRFSLQEFEDVTGLRCYPLPLENELTAATTHCEGDSPYWYTLLGGTLGSLTVKEIVSRLKSESNMPMWGKFRLCLIVIVEGILLCRNQPVKPSAEVVEMVKDVDFFKKISWGRHSFTRLLRMVKVGSYLPTSVSLLAKLKKSSMSVHGFPLAIQLFAFTYVPLLLKYLPHGRDMSTFLDEVVVILPKCKSSHTTTIFDVGNDPALFVMSPKPRQHVFLTSGYCDPKVKHLESLIVSGYHFIKESWSGGDSSRPLLLYAQKHKLLDLTSSSERSETERNGKKNKKRSEPQDC
ncbi:PREDICTED: uncharacterized protein LOC104742234 [Camelina sativa]|uniref:Uncharacterized protein LOC104742234 n=1 Tax=Camelina sativa TaxID=90675 RepID=A0ABM0VV35_CAMSA|nr:PREDICTED: uncharacterized protein LOC104742234 [Camelina sativa]